jgi:hypothetical protein
MRRFRRFLSVALLLALSVTFPPDPSAVAQDATPTTPAAADALFAETIGLPELRITVTDTGYEGVPSALTAGRYLVTVTNASGGGAGAEFAQMTETVSLEDFQAWWGDFQTNLAAQASGATPTVELNEAIGVMPQTVVEWEMGRTEPTISRLRALTEHFGVRDDQINLKLGQPPTLGERLANAL